MEKRQRTTKEDFRQYHQSPLQGVGGREFGGRESGIEERNLLIINTIR
jgi:hypothetical protein